MKHLTVKVIEGLLETPVPEIYVTLAKNSVLGVDSHSMAELLGTSASEIEETENDPLYQKVRLLIAMEHAKSVMETDSDWDEIERVALQNLAKKVKITADPDFNLKVASIANRAQRRVNSRIYDRKLDNDAQTRVPLTLTHRIVKKLNNKTGEASQEEIRQISVLDGSAQNLTSEEASQFFDIAQVSQRNEAPPAPIPDKDLRALDNRKQISLEELAKLMQTKKQR